MAALGDSITVGVNVARDKVGENPGDSWSVGDAADDGVTSHYERLVALDPAIQGHAADFAQSGARMRDFARQAQEAVAMKAEYVTVMLGANDVCGRGNMTPVETFRQQFRDGAAALKGLSAGARVLVVSVPNLTALWDRYHANRQVHDVWQAFGICPPVLSDAVNATQREAVRERVDAFNAVLAEESAAAGWLYDGGAVHDARIQDEDVGPVDDFHPSIAGQQAIADVTWQVFSASLR
jgi:lysophospholipase L1-like esterase